jgi:hypothetical protein
MSRVPTSREAVELYCSDATGLFVLFVGTTGLGGHPGEDSPDAAHDVGICT